MASKESMASKAAETSRSYCDGAKAAQRHEHVESLEEAIMYHVSLFWRWWWLLRSLSPGAAELLAEVSKQLLRSENSLMWSPLPYDAGESGGGRRCAVVGGGSCEDEEIRRPPLAIHVSGMTTLARAP